jgi:uncharacterized membrane protein (DUF2068 family)
MHRRPAVRLIALFEATKGVLVLMAGLGLLSLLHKDLQDLAVRLVRHSHLNPASHYPQIFINAASNLQDARLMTLAAGAAAYASIRSLEAYGLFTDKAWAEWLAAGSGAVYMPFEMLHLVRHPDALAAVLLLANGAIVAVMVNALRRRRATRR